MRAIFIIFITESPTLFRFIFTVCYDSLTPRFTTTVIICTSMVSFSSILERKDALFPFCIAALALWNIRSFFVFLLYNSFFLVNLLCYEISLLYRLLPEESSETGGWIDPWEASVFVDGPILKVRQLEYGQSESKFLWSMHFPLWIWLSYISHPLQHFMPGGHTSNSQFSFDKSKENELFRVTYNRRE